MRLAFLVVGPEASGNRYLTRLLVSGGCAGAGDYRQPFDDGWHIRIRPPRPERIAVCRSFPHAREWPCLPTLVRELAEDGYTPTVLVCLRRPDVVELSQVGAGHVDRIADARRHYDKALAAIFGGIAESRVDSLPVCYAWLGHDDYRRWLADRLGLASFTEPWLDGNERYG